MRFCAEIVEEYEAEVFVAGGGPAGVAAAVTCAEAGKNVFLAECGGAFGGTGTIGMVPEIMNFDDGENFLADGFGRKIAEGIFGEVGELNRKERAVDIERLKCLYDSLVKKAGVRFNFFTSLVAVEKNDDGKVSRAILFSCGKFFAVKAKVFIDCTGNGDLCVMAGADWELGNERGLTMPATLCSLWADVDFQKRPLRDDSRLEEAIADGVLPVCDKLLPGIKHIHGSVGGGNIGHCFYLNPTDKDSLTEAMVSARKNLRAYENYYKTYLTGYQDMFLCATANMMGVRESRRILGDDILKEEHYDSCAVFENEIGRYSYPKDIHLEEPTPEAYREFEARITKRHGKGESYGIPYGILTPVKLKNVLTAGKCISADRAMQASLRVVPGCYITGQAAGMAAALACEVEGNVRGFSVSKLQQALISIGGYLPNFQR